MPKPPKPPKDEACRACGKEYPPTFFIPMSGPATSPKSGKVTQFCLPCRYAFKLRRCIKQRYRRQQTIAAIQNSIEEDAEGVTEELRKHHGMTKAQKDEAIGMVQGYLNAQCAGERRARDGRKKGAKRGVKSVLANPQEEIMAADGKHGPNNCEVVIPLKN